MKSSIVSEAIASANACYAGREQLDFPLFIKVGTDLACGPFLIRGDRLLQISERAAWAILIAFSRRAGFVLPTHEQGSITRNDLFAKSNVFWTAE